MARREGYFATALAVSFILLILYDDVKGLPLLQLALLKRPNTARCANLLQNCVTNIKLNIRREIISYQLVHQLTPIASHAKHEVSQVGLAQKMEIYAAQIHCRCRRRRSCLILSDSLAPFNSAPTLLHAGMASMTNSRLCDTIVILGDLTQPMAHLFTISALCPVACCKQCMQNRADRAGREADAGRRTDALGCRGRGEREQGRGGPAAAVITKGTVFSLLSESFSALL